MKKTALTLIAIAITGFAATQALAYHGGGGRDGNCGGQMQQRHMTDEQVQAHHATMKERAGFHKGHAPEHQAGQRNANAS